MVTDPPDLTSLTASGGTIDVDVTLLGSALGWSASEASTNPSDFLGLSSAGGVAGSDVLQISYNGNKTTSPRTGTVTLTATGGTGTVQDTVLTITQLAGAEHTLGNTPTYTPALVGSNLTAAGGDISIAFALGGGATGWEAVEALGYVSLTPSNGDGRTPVVVTYEANETFVARPVVITITTTGPSGVPTTKVLTFTQSGAQGLTVVTVPADVEDLSTDAGSIVCRCVSFWECDRLGCGTNDQSGYFSEFE